MTLIIRVLFVLFWSYYVLCGRHCPPVLTANRDWSVVGSANNEVIINGHALERGLQMNNEFRATDAIRETVITSVFGFTC